MKPPPQTKSALPKNIRALGWVSLFTDVSSEMIFPLMPIFITTVLGAGPLALGLIEGISDTISSLLKLFSGIWSDRLKDRRIFVWIGYGLSSLLRSLVWLAPTWPVVLGLRVGDRVGKGLRTSPRDALIAASVVEQQRGHAFGFHRMMDHMGAVTGSIVCAILLALAPDDYRFIFMLAGIPALLSCALLLRVHNVPIVPEEKKSLFTGLPSLPPRFSAFLALVFLFNLGNATDAFLILRLQQNGVSIAMIPLLWGGFNLVRALSNSWLGKLSDTVSRTVMILLGWFLYAAVYGLFSLDLSLMKLVLLFFSYGIFAGLTEGPERALIAAWGHQKKYGELYGWYHFIQSLSLLPASLLFGFLWSEGGFKLAFAVSAGMSAMATLGLAVWIFYPVKSRDGITHEHVFLP